MASTVTQRHGRRIGALRAAFRVARRATAPWREFFRRRRDPLAIQRSVRLAREDRSGRRRRWHVLVDLIHDRCPPNAAIIVDLGTYQGHSSAHIHKYCPGVKRIYAVDIRKPDPARDLISGLPRVTFLHDTSESSATRFADESIDLIFIDADHSEAGVRKDLDAWVPKVKRGGVIAGHDYGSRRHPGVKRAVDDYFASHAGVLELQADFVWWTIK